MHFTVHRQLFLVPDVSETVSSDAIISVFLLFSMTLRILSFSFFFLLHMLLFSFNVSMLTVQKMNWQPPYLTGSTVAQSPVPRFLSLVWPLAPTKNIAANQTYPLPTGTPYSRSLQERTKCHTSKTTQQVLEKHHKGIYVTSSLPRIQ